MTYAVLDNQLSDVFVKDSLLDELDVSRKDVNVQVNTIIVGTNTLQMRKVSGLLIQDVNAEHSMAMGALKSHCGQNLLPAPDWNWHIDRQKHSYL